MPFILFKVDPYGILQTIYKATRITESTDTIIDNILTNNGDYP